MSCLNGRKREEGAGQTGKREAGEALYIQRAIAFTLEPLNPDFELIVVTGANEDELRVIAELVDVLGG